MNRQLIIDECQALGLRGIADAFVNLLESPDMRDLSFEDKLSYLLDAEVHQRTQRKQERLLKAARLKVAAACIEDIDYHAPRGLDRSYIASLKNGDWLQRNQYLLITGATGVGKTWLACAFGNLAIRLGHSVIYKRFPLLLEELDIAHRDGSLPKLRMQLSKAKLLILDDWGIATVNARGRQDLLEVIEERNGCCSLIITSQLPVNKWHEYLGEPTMADAILDRIIHRAHRIELSGGSMRKLHSLTQEV